MTTIRMHGPTSTVGGELAKHAEAVAAEAVSNVLRHSGASRLTLDVSVADMFALDVIDNGCGIPVDNSRNSGLANIRYRAERLGGTCEITSSAEGGTRVHWIAPLTDH